MTRPVRIGVQLAPQHSTYAVLRDRVREIEDLGADVVFNWDHFYPLSGDRDGLHFESWTMLAAIAEQTSRIELGALVNCNSYRNANLQADMARTIDHISGGRFIFGTAGSRLDALARDLPIIEERWGRLNPAPTRDIPILIGGGGERKTLRIVAQHANIWHSFSDAEALARKLVILAEHGRDVGRDTSEIEVSIELRERTPAEADELRALGASLFTIGISDAAKDLTPVKKWIAWRDATS